MTDRLSNLKGEGKISDIEYQTYLVFRGDDIGVRYLQKALMSIVMEEPIDPRNTLFAWHDGRRSVWRDIQRMIDKVESLMKGEKK